MASPILHPLVLSSSHNITTSQSGTIFHHVTNLFSSCCQKPCISRLPQPYPHTRSYRGFVRMYLWYSKRRKGWILAIPNTKMLCQDQFCIATTEACRQNNVPTFGCRADMSPTCWRHYQPSPYKGLGGNKKLPPRSISTVGIVRKVLSIRTQLTHKHHHHGGAVCPSYGMLSLDLPDRTWTTSL